MNKRLAIGKVTPRRTRAVVLGGIALAALGGAGSVVCCRYLASQRLPAAKPANLAYQSGGYGGYQSVPLRTAPVVSQTSGKKSALAPPVMAATPDAMAPALAAYGKGQFAAAESAAEAALREARRSQGGRLDAAQQRVTVKSLHLLAFTAARGHNLTLARERFAQERTEAARLPDHGKPTVDKPAVFGAEPTPTFEENAAYQHAVCTAALGDRAGAEAEYLAFMRQYPDSPLLQAAVKRISWLHGGNISKDAEATWEAAMKIAMAHQKQAERNASLCGPACLAEALRRAGKSGSAAASTARLANEMHTDERGTTLLGLQKVARRHGFAGAQGVALTMQGLGAQALPVIARVQPEHYVLVESVEPTGGDVRVWDPDAKGLNRGGAVTVPARRWAAAWQGGVALTLRAPTAVAAITGQK